MVERYSYAQARATDMARSENATFDAGLRSYMLSVYNYMASGLLVTGIVALLTSQSPAMLNAIYGTGLHWVVALAPLGFVLALSFGVNKMSSGTMQMVFWAFAATMGLSLSYIFIAYTGASVARTFFITAGAFGALSLYGYTTKRNLSAMGAFLMMGLFGIIIASIVNFFLQSSMLQFVVSVAGVLVFSGLIAYDTQRIREQYYMMSTGDMMKKGAIMGALSLYLDFINLFLFLLRLMGNRE